MTRYEGEMPPTGHSGDIYVSRGHCRCKALSATLVLATPPGAISPRACQCAFCLEHSVVTLTDPQGHLTIEAIEPSLVTYRFWGSDAATLHCARCGTYVAVLMRKGRGLAGDLNIRGVGLTEFDDVTAIPVDDEREAPVDKLKRRLTQYMPIELVNITPPQLTLPHAGTA